MPVKCMFCGKPADPGWETCGACDIEQAQLNAEEDAEAEEESFAREFSKNVYAEQEEINYLDSVLFGGH